MFKIDREAINNYFYNFLYLSFNFVLFLTLSTNLNLRFFSLVFKIKVSNVL